MGVNRRKGEKIEAYKQEKFEVMQRARAYGITMMVGTQDECDIAFFDFKKKLDSFEDMTFEAGAASRDSEVTLANSLFAKQLIECDRLRASREAEVAELKKDATDFHGQVNRLTEWNNNLVSHRDELLAERDQLRNQLAAAQARIDELMLEYCPDEINKWVVL